MKLELLLKDAFNISQNKQNVIGIWWYDIRTKELQYSETARGHLDNQFTLNQLAKNDKNIVRGRLVRVNNKNYLIIFNKISPFNTYTLRSKIEDESRKLVDFVVDDEGYSLQESKT